MTWWAINLSYQQSHLKNTWVLCNSKRLFQLRIRKTFSVLTKRLSLFNLFCWEECIKVVCVCQVSLSFPSTVNINNSQAKIVWARHWVERKIFTASVTKIFQIFSFYQAYMEFFVAGNFTFWLFIFGHKLYWIWQLHFLLCHTEEQTIWHLWF